MNFLFAIRDSEPKVGHQKSTVERDSRRCILSWWQKMDGFYSGWACPPAARHASTDKPRAASRSMLRAPPRPASRSAAARPVGICVRRHPPRDHRGAHGMCRAIAAAIAAAIATATTAPPSPPPQAPPPSQPSLSEMTCLTPIAQTRMKAPCFPGPSDVAGCVVYAPQRALGRKWCRGDPSLCGGWAWMAVWVGPRSARTCERAPHEEER